MEFFHACVYDYIFFFLLCISPFFHVSVYLFADMFAMHLNMCYEPFIESLYLDVFAQIAIVPLEMWYINLHYYYFVVD